MGLLQRHYGRDGDPLVLVAKGASRELNPSLPQSLVDRALERDYAAASAEYLAAFRTDIEGFVSRDIVEACVTPKALLRHSLPNVRCFGFCDPSGGSADSMTLAIAHHDKSKDIVVLDMLRETKPPFSPEAVVKEFSEILKSYRVTSIVGDRYAGQWPVEQFAKCGIKYQHSEITTSDLYKDLLPLLNSGRIDLLDHPRLINQLCGLERHVGRSGRDQISHFPGGHDDLANAVAGVASITSPKRGEYDTSMKWVDGVGIDKTKTQDAPQQNKAAAMLTSYLFNRGYPF